MDDQQQPVDAKVPRPWQPRYGLGGLLLVMLIASVMATAGFYFVRGMQGQREYQAAFILVTLIAPVLLVVIVSGLRAVLGGRRRS
jgi:Na+/melibiose symporter-like transporter